MSVEAAWSSRSNNASKEAQKRKDQLAWRNIVQGQDGRLFLLSRKALSIRS
jgi:hypothetical protein